MTNYTKSSLHNFRIYANLNNVLFTAIENEAGISGVFLLIYEIPLITAAVSYIPENGANL